MRSQGLYTTIFFLLCLGLVRPALSAEDEGGADEDIRLAAARIRDALGDGWKVETRGQEISLELPAPLAFAEVEYNSPPRTEEEERAYEAQKPTHNRAGRLTLRFQKKLAIAEFEKLRQENLRSEAEHERLRATVRHIPHKFDEYLPQNAEQRRQLAAYRREVARLKFHDPPDLYTQEHSIRLTRSWFAWEYAHEDLARERLQAGEETLLRLFGVYDPAVSSGRRSCGKYLDSKEPR